MTDYNAILTNLLERVVQDTPYKLIYANNAFNVFDKGTDEMYGSEREFIGDQPLEGVVWDKKLTTDWFEEFPTVFSHHLGIILNKVYYTIINKREIKKALQGPEQEASLLERLTDSMKTKPILDINEKIAEIISNTSNYRKNWETTIKGEKKTLRGAITYLDKEASKINSREKAINALEKIVNAGNAMVEPSSRYNKGYQYNKIWNEVKTNVESTKI